MKPGATSRLISNSWSCDTLVAGIEVMAARGDAKKEPEEMADDALKAQLVDHG